MAETEKPNDATSALPATEKPEVTHAAYKDPNRPHTRGEKWFHRIVHIGIDFGANSFGSIIFTDWWTHRHAKGLKIGPLNFGFDHCIEKTGEWISKIPGMSATAEAQHKNGKLFMSLVGLSVVGWAVLLPMKWMKDHELEVVKWLDKKLDKGRPLNEQEQRDRAIAYDAIEHRPRQTNGTVIMSRIKGWTMFNVIPSFAYNWVAHKVGVKTLQEMFDAGAIAASKTLSPESERKFGDTFRRLASLTGLEALGCSLTAFGIKNRMDADERHRGHKMAKESKAPKAANTSTAEKSPSTEVSLPAEPKKSLADALEKKSDVKHAERLNTPAASYEEAAKRAAEQRTETGISAG